MRAGRIPRTVGISDNIPMLNLLHRHPSLIALGGALLLSAMPASGQPLHKQHRVSDPSLHQKPLSLRFDETRYLEPGAQITAQFYLKMQEFAAARTDGLRYDIEKITPRMDPSVRLDQRRHAEAVIKRSVQNSLNTAQPGEVRVRVALKADLKRYDPVQQAFPLKTLTQAQALDGNRLALSVYLPSIARTDRAAAPYAHFAKPVPSIVVLPDNSELTQKLPLSPAAAEWLGHRNQGSFEKARVYLYLRLVGAEAHTFGPKAGPELMPVWNVEHVVFEDWNTRERLAAE